MDKIIGLLEKYYPVYLQGLWGTLWISAVTVLLGTVLGVLVAVLRMSRSKALNGIDGVKATVTLDPPVAEVEFTSGYEIPLEDLQKTVTDQAGEYTLSEM